MQEQDESLRFNQSFFSTKLIFGVPRNLFVVSMVMSVGAFFMIGWLAGVLIFLLLIPPLVSIHKNDEQALYFLIDKIARPDIYSGAYTIKNEVRTVYFDKGKYISKNYKTERYQR